MTNHKFLSILFISTVISTSVFSQNLIPQPQELLRTSNKQFVFKNITKALVVKIDTNLQLPSTEGYILDIQKNKITIKAKSPQAVVWAKQTLKQLEKVSDNGILLPNVKITDYPAFPIRGFMLDNGRNFMEIPLLKHYLELMSFYKVNVFHWHLTDNPAWRIECKAYPQLNDPQFQTKGRDEGKFYSYRKIRELIAYAKNLGITVIPEIDMPGHSAYFQRTFGFKMESAEGMKVLEVCLSEFFKEIPQLDCPYFHIGSDEVHIANTSEFMQWCETIVQKNGRKAIAWDPGLKGSSSTIRQIWIEGANQNTSLTKSESNYIDSYMGYLNYFDPMVFTNKLILHNTLKTEKHLGGILCLWNDVRVVDKSKIAVHNGFLNGLMPFAERFWTGSTASFSGNPLLLPSPTSDAGKFVHEFEKRMIFHRDTHLKNEAIYWVASSQLSWQLSQPIAIDADTIGLKWHKAWGGSIDLESYLKTTGVKSLAQMKVIAKTELIAKTDTFIYAWVGFETAARSNRISGGIGKTAEWENKGEVYINGQILTAPQWQEPGAYAFKFATWGRPEEQLPYTDEQFYWMRKPLKINLIKGINTVEIISYKNFDGQRWNFNFTPLCIDSNGKLSEVKGITYLK